jgi:hypothetical protein
MQAAQLLPRPGEPPNLPLNLAPTSPEFYVLIAPKKPVIIPSYLIASLVP